MTLEQGTPLGSCQVLAPNGTGGPASARVTEPSRELRRGLAEAEPGIRS